MSKQGLEGYSRDPGFYSETVRDLGFYCSREAGLTKIGHGMRDSDMKRKWDAGFSRDA